MDTTDRAAARDLVLQDAMVELRRLRAEADEMENFITTLRKLNRRDRSPAASKSGDANGGSATWAEHVDTALSANMGHWMSAQQIVQAIKTKGVIFPKMKIRDDVLIRSALKRGGKRYGWATEHRGRNIYWSKTRNLDPSHTNAR